MQFFTLSTLTIAFSTLAIAAPSTFFVEKSDYTKNFAPANLQRLSDFASEHKTTLSNAQVAYLSRATAAVSSFDTSSFDSLKGEAEALFSAADARFILTGKTTSATTKREEGNLMTKRTSCSCSTDSDWCDNDTYCAGNTGCYLLPTGCGTWDGYQCDGLCRGN
jgi:hypothetical protein